MSQLSVTILLKYMLHPKFICSLEFHILHDFSSPFWWRVDHRIDHPVRPFRGELAIK